MDVLTALLPFGAPAPAGDGSAAEEGFTDALETALSDLGPDGEEVPAPAGEELTDVPPLATLALLLAAFPASAPLLSMLDGAVADDVPVEAHDADADVSDVPVPQQVQDGDAVVSDVSMPVGDLDADAPEELTMDGPAPVAKTDAQEAEHDGQQPEAGDVPPVRVDEQGAEPSIADRPAAVLSETAPVAESAPVPASAPLSEADQANEPAPDAPAVDEVAAAETDQAEGRPGAERTDAVRASARSSQTAETAAAPPPRAATDADASTDVPVQGAQRPVEPVRASADGASTRGVGVAAPMADAPGPVGHDQQVATEPAGAASREIVDRLTEIVDRMSSLTAPRRMVVEAGELRLAVALSGSTVSVTVLGAPRGDTPDWAPQLAAALSARGMELSADSDPSGRGREQSGRGQRDPDQPAPPPGRRTPSSRPYAPTGVRL